MEAISDFMEGDHRRCDEFFVAAEQSAAKGDWQAADDAYRKFHQAIEHHFAMEEEVLFPAFEQASGSAMGPTQVMRMEHGQMRALFEEMRQAVAARQADAFLGAAETLLILMQQHNMKEEQILYPMTDRLLTAGRERVLQEMRAVA